MIKKVLLKPRCSSLPIFDYVNWNYDETFFINLNDATNATIADALGVGTILDNDEPPKLTINHKSIIEGDNGTNVITFTVSLDAPSAKLIIVDYATVDGTAKALSDYMATSGNLTFAPGETTKTVSVIVNGDRDRGPDETFFVKLANATNATFSRSQSFLAHGDRLLPGANTSTINSAFYKENL